MLEIRDLHASAGDVPILKGIDLRIGDGEVHAVMGPNGSGKSTLANVLAGRPGFEKTRGEILYRGADLCELAPADRAREGVFLAFQYPVEIPGVANNYFLKASLNAIRAHRGEEELDAETVDALADLWRKVHLEDHEICERLQRGRASQVAEDGGILSPHWEDSLQRFQDLVRAATA